MDRADRLIEGNVAICPACRDRQSFSRLPLAVITGASGAGKTSVCRALLGRDTGWVLLDTDVLRPPAVSGDYYETWLRFAKSVNQSGRPVVLFTSAVPEEIETKIERRYFAQTHYLALVCEQDEQVRRLRARPSWQGDADDDVVQRAVDLDAWFRSEGPNQVPEVQLLDTSGTDLEDVLTEVEAWLLQIRW